MKYIGEIVFYVHGLIYKAITYLCVDEQVRASLWLAL